MYIYFSLFSDNTEEDILKILDPKIIQLLALEQLKLIKQEISDSRLARIEHSSTHSTEQSKTGETGSEPGLQTGSEPALPDREPVLELPNLSNMYFRDVELNFKFPKHFKALLVPSLDSKQFTPIIIINRCKVGTGKLVFALLII